MNKRHRKKRAKLIALRWYGDRFVRVIESKGESCAVIRAPSDFVFDPSPTPPAPQLKS